MIIPLWPDGPPTRFDDMPPETRYISELDPAAPGSAMYRNVSEPTLTVVAPAAGTSNGVGVIVMPGGGWTIHAWTHEGTAVADWLTPLGYTVFLVKYRVQPSEADQAAFEQRWAAGGNARAGLIRRQDKPSAISDLVATDVYLQARAAAAADGRRAIAIVRERATEFGIRPEALGMLGFSAGGFAIVDIALDPQAEQVAFIAPIYGGEIEGRPVPADAPPLFTAVAQDDVLVRMVEGVHAAWTDADRPAEIHSFRRGNHGFGMLQRGLPVDRWVDLCLAWLEDLAL